VVATPNAISKELAAALSNPTTSRILMELSAGPLSTKQCWEKMGGDFATVYRAMKRLEGWGLVRLRETKTGGSRRGGTEHIYESTERAWVRTPEWEDLSPMIRSDLSRNILDSYMVRVREAVEAGTFGSEPDGHLSWDTVTLDRQAWLELSETLDGVLESLARLEAESKERLGATGGEEIPTTVALSEFRSPPKA
jgi:DNA-binding transcriptional ArsR family regulator